MAYLADQLLNGLSLGTVYALIAIGFAMVYGVLKFLNFAHFEIFTTGTFTGYFVLTAVAPHVPAVLAVLVAMCASAFVGALVALVIERVAYRPIRGEPKVTVLVTAIAVSILMENLGIQVFSAHTRGFPSIELPIASKQVALLLLAATYAFHHWLVHCTDTGVRLRAVAEKPDTVRLMGVNPNRHIMLAFIVGGVFAGIAGVIWGLVYGTVNPQMGFVPGLKAFIIAVVGGIGNLKGTFLMGVGLGVIEALVAGYLTSELSGFKESIVFGILLLLLVWRPNGIFSGQALVKV